MTGNGGKDGGGCRRAGTAEGRLVIRPGFDDGLPEEIRAGFEGRDPGGPPDATRYVIVELGEGGQVNRPQTPSEANVEPIVLDADAYTEPPPDRTRSDLEPYERCGRCGEARMVHRDGSGPVLREHMRCDAFEPTGKTLGGDDLPDWEDR